MVEEEEDTYIKRFTYINKLILSILLIIGIFGNSITVVVYFKSNLKKVRPFLYLVGLAICDSITFLFHFIHNEKSEWFNKNNVIVNEIYICVGQIVTLTSVWLIVAVSLNRYISLKYPLYSKSMLILLKTKLIILSILSISIFITFVSALLFYYNKKYGLKIEIFISLIRFWIPFPFLLLLNILTIILMKKYNKNNIKIFQQSKHQYELTKLLLTCSFMLLLIMPYEILHGLMILYKLNVLKLDLNFFSNPYLTRTVDYCTVFSYCGDFFVYCLSGKLYRDAVAQMFRKIK